MKIKSVWFSVCAVLVMVLALAGGVVAAEKAAMPKATAGKIVLELPPVPGNPRNSEGAFAELGDGKILFVYSHFLGARGAIMRRRGWRRAYRRTAARHGRAIRLWRSRGRTKR